MASIADLIQEEAKTLPEHLGEEVLDFIGYLRTRHPVSFESGDQAARLIELEAFFSHYPRIPKNFKFKRDEANER
ncbi:DUF2281 domain-containing protein [Thiorhodovibrio frisius]|uniref:DUF2281 domain-containing protein n=1 Tax=Thiorhodovibrio frisius TaxID=631362 RepID=H8Z2D2_9GAMM|nr:DUF2281 domain-containing protein [Thiorhodovibrio frisius]EIC21587.1 Protein of unknown function (DUF2281) [Thiorhodovibrio frisius]WPL21554.1 hypothetical protein Thiofri_01680 [Thiorhodovibrio frisius]